ncbi:MAG TPA: hypothetical protein VD948_01925 [Rhodothermales bacterium]|nr:hypothetical protein [Rhodothermales bacterium]
MNRGAAAVEAGGKTFRMAKRDVLYVGLGEAVTVRAEGSVGDVSEFRATSCSTKYLVQLVRHADIEGTEQEANVGSKRPMTRGAVYKLVDQNVHACRLLFTSTFGPEQAVIAHRLVRGEVMLPVHWGQSDLAKHGWTEPIERVLAAARTSNVRVAATRPGGMVEPAALAPLERWWPTTPWETAEEAPVWSTSAEHLRNR